MSDLEVLIRESRRLQDELVRFQAAYRGRSRSAPLSPTVLHEVRKATRRFLDLQAALDAVVLDNAPGWRASGRIATHDAAARAACAAEAMRYDNLFALLPLLRKRHYRRLVNRPDLGYGIGKDELWKVVDAMCAPHARRRLQAALQAVGPRDAGPPSSEDGSLQAIIKGTATYELVTRAQLERRLPGPVPLRRARILDGLAELGEDAFYVLSEGFGNAIGRVALRKGKLWAREDVLGHLHKVLQPLDILLEKTPFRLTDLLIPGHFGHVAVWMGRPGKLKRMRVWEHPDLQDPRWQACRPLVEDGRGVLEALREGVELNPLRVFANVDDLAILRPRRLGRKRRMASLVRGFHQFGKEYDFNFDVESTGTIVCSELPYHVYPWVDWQTDEQLGRFTISPDDIARAALGDDPHFEVLAFYHDGALVPPDRARDRMLQLMEA